LPNEAQPQTSEKSAARWPKRLALALIRFYQNVISPRTPPTCFFYPTCSHYTYQAIDRFGCWRGVWLGLSRMCRCHPFARGGYDPVPQEFSMFPARQRPEELRKDLDE
jgi:putative membrane protein insertion efficiency factor